VPAPLYWSTSDCLDTLNNNSGELVSIVLHYSTPGSVVVLI
jgi:hypothetical protein